MSMTSSSQCLSSAASSSSVPPVLAIFLAITMSTIMHCTERASNVLAFAACNSSLDTACD
eukprot:8898135-Karenia_brevis.AAC.1